jgi:hypothetical protein
MTKEQLLYADPLATLPNRMVMSAEQRLAKWRDQGAYSTAPMELLAAYTPERVASLLAAAKMTKSLSAMYWEFGGNGGADLPAEADLADD